MKQSSEHGASVSATNLHDSSDPGNTTNQDEINRLKAANQVSQGYFEEEFPLDSFPEAIQDIIKDCNTGLNFPNEFTAAGMLFAASVIIGNALQVQVKRGWMESPILYLALIGRPGTNKTHPIEWALRPLRETDALAYQQFKETQAKEESDKPTLKKRLVSDATPEALAAVLLNNLRGIGLIVDELAAWFGNFGRYSKGSDQEFFLSNWSGIPVSIDRKTSGPVYIQNPFISICGTLQPSVLGKLAADGRGDNGFLDRFLFIFPPDLEKPGFPEDELKEGTADSWKMILDKIQKILPDWDHGSDLKTIPISDEARQTFKEWFNKNAKAAKDSTDEQAGIRAKFDIQIPRLALILEALSRACGESQDITEIEPATMHRAINLGNYFMRSAFRVRAKISGNPLDALPMNKRSLYDSLPSVFETAAAIKEGAEFGISEPTIYRFLRDGKLFNRTSQGWYSKIIT